MKKSSTAFFTTIFPSCEVYLDDFFISLENQTDTDFDLIIINDGFDDLDSYAKKYTRLNIIEVKSNETPIQNRINGIQFIIAQGYENLFFGDSDDYFAKNRLSVSKGLLEKYEIIVNDLTLFNTTKKTENIFKNIKFSKNDLISENIFGLSNTAIKTRILKNINLKPTGEVIAYDWYLFSLLIFQGFSFKLSYETCSFYRQYDSNTLGISFTLDDKSLDNLVRIKKMHLIALKKYYSSINKNEYYTIFENELNAHIALEVFLESNKNKTDYLSVLNKNIENIFRGWFSQLISLKKYKILNESTNK